MTIDGHHASAEEVAKDAVADMEALYRKHRNPLYVWWAINLRAALPGEAIPSWCLDALDDWASAISAMAFDSTLLASEKAKRLPAALGLSAQGSNVFKQFENDARDNALAGLQRHHVEIDGKIEAAIEHTATLTGYDQTAVKRAKKNSPSTHYLRGRLTKKP